MATTTGRLSDEELDKIFREELHETADLRAQSIQVLRLKLAHDWEHLNGSDLTDAHLTQFLRCRKYDLARVEELRSDGNFLCVFLTRPSQHRTLTNYLHFRLAHQAIFKNMRVDAVEEQLSLGVLQVLPTRARSGAAIVFMRMRHIDIDRFPLPRMIHMVVFIYERLARDPQTQACGILIINNLTGLPLSQMRKTSAEERSVMLHYVQVCPGRPLSDNILT